MFGTVTSLVVYVMNVRRVEYRRLVPIIVAAVLAIIPGAYLSRELPAPVLFIGAGALVLVALALSVLARRLPNISGLPGQLSAGALGGFMNVVAGVGGPALTAYAIATKWEHEKFAISIQFYFIVIGCASLLFRGTMPTLTGVEWLVATAALVLGVVAGQFAVRWVSANVARVGCLVLALLGGVLTIVRGAVELAA